ncbi:MAG TPA: hypothetical protein VGN37_29670 [Actinocatenispora sp.]
MSWPEIRTAIDAQLVALRRAYAGWLARRDRLAATRGRAHHVLDGGTSAPPREALAHIHTAYDIGAETGPLLAAAVTSIEQYLAAVDPDNAAGAVAGLPGPKEVGDPHGGHGGPDAPGERQPLGNVWRRRGHVYTEQGGPAGFRDFLARGAGLFALHTDWHRAGGHPDRHGGATTDRQLVDRLRYGHDPLTGKTVDWETGKRHRCGDHATAYRRDQALAWAEMCCYASRAGTSARETAERQGRRAFAAQVAACDVFGPGFRAELRGYSRDAASGIGIVRIDFPDNTIIRAHYRRDVPDGEWLLVTCFPDIPKVVPGGEAAT